MDVSLSRRLGAAAEYVRAKSYCADIGCDHGKLSAYLIESGRCERVDAADLRPGPLSKARSLFEQLGIEGRARALLSNGFEKVSPEVTDAVIAGIGADNTLEIIAECDFIKRIGVRLVLVPATRHALLRAGIAEMGFQIVAEKAVCEYGHCYTVIAADYTGVKRTLSHGEAAAGLIRPSDGAEAARYIDEALGRAERALCGLSAAKNADRARIDELTETINFLRGIK